MKTLFKNFTANFLNKETTKSSKLCNLPINEQIAYIEEYCQLNGIIYDSVVKCTIQKEYANLNDKQKLAYISANPDMLQKLLSNPNTICNFNCDKNYSDCTLSQKLNHLKLITKIGSDTGVSQNIVGGNTFVDYLEWVRSLSNDELLKLINELTNE